MKATVQSLPLKDKSLFRQQCYINGQWVDADSGKTVDVTNPATGELLRTIPLMGSWGTRPRDRGGECGLGPWRKKTAKERANILRKWFNLMMENQEDLAMLMTAEQGKPMMESKGEIAYAASFIEWFAEEGKRIYGDVPASAGQAHHRHQGADRRRCGDHAVEFPERHDHPQGRPGAWPPAARLC